LKNRIHTPAKDPSPNIRNLPLCNIQHLEISKIKKEDDTHFENSNVGSRCCLGAQDFSLSFCLGSLFLIHIISSSA